VIVTRRTALLAAIGTTTPFAAGWLLRAPSAYGAEERFAALEQQRGGRLGIAARETGTGRQIGYRADERFP
jgi:beta-lactamase class A